MVRNAAGAVLALVGAASAVYSPFRAWYDGRHGRTFRLSDLFSATGIGSARPELFVSLFLPFAFAALVTLIGIVLRSRPLVTSAGVLVLGFTILWMVRQGQARGSLMVDGSGSGLGIGVANALGGGALLLIAAAVMSGRRRRRRGAHGAYGPPAGESGRYRDREPYQREPHPHQDAYQDPEPYEQEPYPYEDPHGGHGSTDTASMPTMDGWEPPAWQRPPPDDRR